MSRKEYPIINHDNLPSIRKFDGHDWFITKTSRRNLPHWELKGSTYFITMNVLPEVENPFLSTELANLVISILKKEDKKLYLLQAYVVMPDHTYNN